MAQNRGYIPKSRQREKPRGGLKYIGQSMKRVEDPRIVTGRGVYADDIQLLDMAHVAIVRSPHAHARIRRIDTSKAEKLPGVLAVVTGARAAELCDPLPTWEDLIASGLLESLGNEQLLEALKALPPADREVLDLYYFHQLTDDGVAVRLGLTTGAVTMRRRRAIKKLRRTLGAGRDRGRDGHLRSVARCVGPARPGVPGAGRDGAHRRCRAPRAR